MLAITSSQDEILRPALGREGYRDIDMVLTTRETARWMKERGVSNWNQIPVLEYDHPLSEVNLGKVTRGSHCGIVGQWCWNAVCRDGRCYGSCSPHCVRRSRVWCNLTRFHHPIFPNCFISVTTHTRLERLDFTEVRGFEGLKQATIELVGKPLKIAVVHVCTLNICPSSFFSVLQGARNVQKLLDAVHADRDHLGLSFVEVMACQGGLFCAR